jgi:hypothetical protein
MEIKLQFQNAKNPATEKQIEYIYKFDNFSTKLSKTQVKKRLDIEAASDLIDKLKDGDTIKLVN